MDILRQALQYAANCCLSCREETSRGEISERTHLLVDPVLHNSPQVTEDSRIIQNSQVPRRDQQSALNRIIQETATNIIDVAAMEHNLEQQEYNDRYKMYSHRLAQQWNAIQHPSINHHNGLLKDIPNIEIMLASNPISLDDMLTIRNFVKEAASAIEEIRVEHTEDLVVPFQVT